MDDRADIMSAPEVTGLTVEVYVHRDGVYPEPVLVEGGEMLRSVALGRLAAEIEGLLVR